MMTHQPQMQFPTVSLQRLLVTTNGRRGDGKTEDSDDPHRGITEFWTLDGQKLAEVDPCDPERWIKLQEKIAGLELSAAVTASEIREAKRLMEQRDRMILEINTEKKEAQDRVRVLEEAIRWALGEHPDGFGQANALHGGNKFWWRIELRERAGMDKATSTSLPAAELAP